MLHPRRQFFSWCPGHRSAVGLRCSLAVTLAIFSCTTAAAQDFFSDVDAVDTELLNTRFGRPSDFSVVVPEHTEAGTPLLESAAGTQMRSDFQIDSGNERGVFRIDADTGRLDVVDSRLLDFEHQTEFVLSLSARVREEDRSLFHEEFEASLLDSGLSPDQLQRLLHQRGTATACIRLQDVNEPPVLSEHLFQLPETTAAGTVVGQMTAVDPDRNDSLTYEITSGNDDHLFDVDPLSGQLRFVSAPDAVLDFERSSQHVLTVAVTDRAGKRAETTVRILVDDVDELPVPAMDSFAFTVDSDQSLDLGTIDVIDPDQHAQLAFDLAVDPTNGGFELDNRTGMLSMVDAGRLTSFDGRNCDLSINVWDNACNLITVPVTVAVQLPSALPVAPAIAAARPGTPGTPGTDTTVRPDDAAAATATAVAATADSGSGSGSGSAAETQSAAVAATDSLAAEEKRSSLPALLGLSCLLAVFIVSYSDRRNRQLQRFLSSQTEDEEKIVACLSDEVLKEAAVLAVAGQADLPGTTDAESFETGHADAEQTETDSQSLLDRLSDLPDGGIYQDRPQAGTAGTAGTASHPSEGHSSASKPWGPGSTNDAPVSAGPADTGSGNTGPSSSQTPGAAGLSPAAALADGRAATATVEDTAATDQQKQPYLSDGTLLELFAVSKSSEQPQPATVSSATEADAMTGTSAEDPQVPSDADRYGESSPEAAASPRSELLEAFREPEPVATDSTATSGVVDEEQEHKDNLTAFLARLLRDPGGASRDSKKDQTEVTERAAHDEPHRNVKPRVEMDEETRRASSRMIRSSNLMFRELSKRAADAAIASATLKRARRLTQPRKMLIGLLIATSLVLLAVSLLNLANVTIAGNVMAMVVCLAAAEFWWCQNRLERLSGAASGVGSDILTPPGPPDRSRE
ncbi:MAG: cadherin domain-containing protein [Fuerstiella sp.]